MIIGLLLLLIGFFTDQKDTYDLQLQNNYLVTGQAMAIRTVGILTVLNGLLYFLIENKFIHYNRRFKYFGIILFFISLIITFIVVAFFAVSNGVGGGHLFSLNAEQNGTATLFLLAGIFTLFFSLLMPLIILVLSFFKKM